MSRKQSKEVVANQDLLIEASQFGGPDNLRQHYLNQGAQQERTRIISAGKTGLSLLWKFIEPIALKFAVDKLFAFFEKKETLEEAEPKQND